MTTGLEVKVNCWNAMKMGGPRFRLRIFWTQKVPLTWIIFFLYSRFYKINDWVSTSFNDTSVKCHDYVIITSYIPKTLQQRIEYNENDSIDLSLIFQQKFRYYVILFRNVIESLNFIRTVTISFFLFVQHSNRLNLFHLQFDSWEIYFRGDFAAEEASYRALHSIEPLMNNFGGQFDEFCICRLSKFSNFLELSLEDVFNFKKVRIRSFWVSIHLKIGSICKLWINVTQYNRLLPH